MNQLSPQVFFMHIDPIAMSHTIRLIHWNAAEAEEKGDIIRAAGYDVACELPTFPAMRELRDDPPRLFVIDLSRLPSQGRDVALRLRAFKSTRHVPILFLEGDPEKVARIRELLPDAIYSTWKRIRSALKEAMALPPSDISSAPSTFAAFAGTPLVKKLGIGPGSRIALLNAPDDFEETLGELPEGASVQRTVSAGCDLALRFIRSSDELRRDIEWIQRNLGSEGIWIVWPKKSAGFRSDLSQGLVREIAFGAGLVDFKVCSLDAVWTGMKFTRRKRG